jgi:hypothetical protein
MSDHFELLATLRAKYPDDESLARIEAEETRVKTLLRHKQFATLEVTQELLALCRKDIVAARRKLATDRTLVDDEAAQRALWSLIDARMWFIQMIGRDFEGELQLIEMELATDLER